jgi:protein-arginine kinase activator protein McsA
MKPEYKEKALSYIDGIANRTKTIQEMMEGKRPANQEQAIRLAMEIQRLLEQTQNIVELS